MSGPDQGFAVGVLLCVVGYVVMRVIVALSEHQRTESYAAELDREHPPASDEEWREHVATAPGIGELSDPQATIDALVEDNVKLARHLDEALGRLQDADSLHNVRRAETVLVHFGNPATRPNRPRLASVPKQGGGER